MQTWGLPGLVTIIDPVSGHPQGLCTLPSPSTYAVAMSNAKALQPCIFDPVVVAIVLWHRLLHGQVD